MCLHAGVPLIATDQQLRITFWNPAATRVFGGSPEAMIGQSILSVVPSERRELAERLCRTALDDGEVRQLEFPHRDATGEPRFLAITISPIVDQDGQRIGVSVHVRDVSRRLELERERAHHQKMTALGAMAGAVAHHFNNLLGGIITSIDFAGSSDDPQVLRRALQATSSSLGRMSRLTLSLLTFAEGDQSDQRGQDLTETIRRFIEQGKPAMSARGIAVTTNLEAVGAEMPVKRVLTVLEALTGNAIEAMSDGGGLTFDLSREGDEVVLTITDTGTGIAPDAMVHVFEPFFSTKRQLGELDSEHPGLGLAVVHGIIRDLGGSVTLTSSENGTVCVIRLPSGQP